MARIFFVAGESSGDLHGASLVRALLEMDPELVCEGLGGKHMAQAGVDLQYDLAGNAVMGFVELAKGFGRLWRLFRQTAAYLETTRPDCLVLIDYPGFNLRLAIQAKRLGIPVVYYISPQVWAWKKGRIHTLAKTVEKMLVILPFEEPLYREAGVYCRYVGHPLLDHLPTVVLGHRYRDQGVVGLLPGSREQEIRRHLPVMLEVASSLAQRGLGRRFVAPCVDAEREQQIRKLAGDFPLETVVGGTYEVLDGARFCLVASGTATVETLLFGVPMIVLYRVAPTTYWLARRIVRVEHIAMVNILAGRRIVPEFIQRDARADKILPVAIELVGDTPARQKMLGELAETRKALGEPGASKRAAAEILQAVGKRP